MAGLIESGADVYGLDRSGGGSCFCGDLRSGPFLLGVLRETRPTHVIHLAGVLPGAGHDAVTLYEENVLNTVRLLEGIRVSAADIKVLVASSSAVYGDTRPEENPLSEDRPFRPITEYGVSKAAQEIAVLQQHLAHGLRAVRLRTFNLVGQGQSSQLLLPALAHQIARAEHEPGPIVVHAGNLDSRRDFVDVRDAVRAYVGLAERGAPGEVYNVCGGRGRSARECVDLFARLVNRPIRVECDEALVRRVEIADQVGDATRLRETTGWRPEIPFEESLRDVLNEWRERVRVEREVAR